MSTIEIRTTQNVSIDYELATLRERLIAYFLDMAIFFAAAYILTIFFAVVLAEAIFSSMGEWFFIFFGFFVIACWILYHLLMEVFNRGQTIGKKVMSIQVVRADGREPAFSDNLLRSIFMIIDSMLCMGVVASVLIVSSEKKQRFGDMAANTTVVRKKLRSKFLLQDILKIQSLEDYEPTYPEVKQLNEKDLLLIKNTVSRYEEYRNDAHREAINLLVDRLVNILNLNSKPKKPIEFLKTLIRDYIVLTR